MGDDKNFWQVNIPLHRSKEEITTTCIYLHKNECEYVSSRPGEWYIIRGDVWHNGSSVNSIAEDAIYIEDYPVMPLVSIYFKSF